MLTLDGLKIANDTLKGTKYEYKISHCKAVGDMCYELASNILYSNPELKSDINPDICRFIGYVHDIGYSVNPNDHEIESMNILTTKYFIGDRLASKVIHGHLAEKYAIDGRLNTNYLPVGLEGIILTYCDVSVITNDDDEISEISIEGRLGDIIKRVKDSDLDELTKSEVEQSIIKAYPRFKRYENIIFDLLSFEIFEDGNLSGNGKIVVDYIKKG